MSILRFSSRINQFKKIDIACLTKHKLMFHKISKKDGSGKCDIYETNDQNDKVYGVLYRIDKRYELALDRFEGFKYGYDKKIIDVINSAGDQLKAMTYFATNIDNSLKPYNWYKYHVLYGAIENHLPYEYISNIEYVDSIIDKDSKRVFKELSIYHIKLSLEENG